MPGYNHFHDCPCPWCVRYRRGGRATSLYKSEGWEPTFTTYASFTTPNASCPVCGASVFFYQSPTGGRVFFDELGPPWPKHPCTDNRSLSVSRLAPGSAPSAPTPQWQKEGWEPIRVRSSRLDSNWHAIPVGHLNSRTYFDVLADAPLIVSGEFCAFMRPWDNNGWSQISLVDLDGSAREMLIPIFERKRHFRSSRTDAVSRRRKAEIH